MNINETHEADQVPEESSSAPQASKAGEEKILDDKGSAPEAVRVRQNASTPCSLCAVSLVMGYVQCVHCGYIL